MQTPILKHLEHRLSDFFSEHICIHRYVSILGGDINEAFLLRTSAGNFFMKLNTTLHGTDLFEKEAAGLKLLANAECIKVPQVLFTGQHEQQVYLLMSYIEQGSPTPHSWKTFGEQLSNLHRKTNRYFGLEYDNYIGSLPQLNTTAQQWGEFYRMRIMELASMAIKQNVLENKYLALLEKLAAKFAEIFPAEPPALLHGDLWSGNFMVDTTGAPVIYDPAVYYGHREMDIAMTLLFGGFDQKMYEAYHYHYPLQPGWQKRMELCQLYPLLVHLVLFGGHYHRQVVEILAGGEW